MKSSRQTPHYRRSKKGKSFVAGKGTRKVKKRRQFKPRLDGTGPNPECPDKMRRGILASYQMDLQKILKQTGRANIPHIGVLRVKVKPARKGGKKVFMPMLGKEVVLKSRPRMKMVKFRAAKALKERLN